MWLMSNVHRHWHYHGAGRFHVHFDERHEDGWHDHIHIHTRRVPDEVDAGDEHVDSVHGHDHISSEWHVAPQPV